MSYRPLAVVSGLTLGDYLLWNWSLSGSRDIPALISGLTLPPLAVAFAWLLALSVAHLLARSPRRAPVLAGRARSSRGGYSARRAERPARRAAEAGARGQVGRAAEPGSVGAAGAVIEAGTVGEAWTVGGPRCSDDDAAAPAAPSSERRARELAA